MATARLFRSSPFKSLTRGNTIGIIYSHTSRRAPFLRTMASTTTIPSTMTGVLIESTGGTEVLQYRTDMPVPQLKEDEVLVKNEILGVNYIDTYYRSGLYPAKFPYTLGREAAGTVVATGPGVNIPSLAVGTRVVWMSPGAFAEYSAVPTRLCLAIPPAITSEVAAASILQGMTALTLIREAHPVRAGDWVLVHAAAGGVGLWLCQLLKAIGARTIATASTPEKRELAKAAGAEVLVDYTTEDFVEGVKQATNGQGVVAAFDGVGKATFDGSLASLARKGSLVSFGNASGPVPPFTISRLTEKNAKVLRPTMFNYFATREEFEPYATELFDLIIKHNINVRIHKVYPLKEIAQAQQDLEGRGTTGKLLLKF